MQPYIRFNKGGDDYPVVCLSTYPHSDHRSTGIPRRQGNGVFAHSKRGHLGGHYREPANTAGIRAADLPATKTQNPERRTIQVQ